MLPSSFMLPLVKVISLNVDVGPRPRLNLILSIILFLVEAEATEGGFFMKASSYTGPSAGNTTVN